MKEKAWDINNNNKAEGETGRDDSSGALIKLKMMAFIRRRTIVFWE